jgi:hypothetical protein
MTTQTVELKENSSSEAMNRIDFDEDTLINLSLFDKNRLSVENIKIALITDNNDLRKLNYYLFKDVSDVDYFTFDDTKIDLDLIEEMDIIIYSRAEDAIKNEILHHIKAKNLKTKFMMISDKPYLRQKDILQEHINGVDKLMKMDFFLEDYILSIEKYLYSNFYSKRLLDLPDLSEVITYDKDILKRRIDDLIQRKIYFSLFRYSYHSEIDIEEYNLKKIVREHDTIYIDKESGEIYFLLLNVIPEFGEQIIKKRINNFSITLTPEASCNVFDIVFEDEEAISV